MILTLMDQMSMMLYGNVWFALAGSLLWGIASVVLSPCHLSSIPLVMAFVGKESGGKQKRALQLSIVFTLGIMMSMLLLGLITAALGRLLGDVGSWGYWLGALVFGVVAILLLDVIQLPVMSMNQNRFRGGGVQSACILGMLFGTVLGPCAFAFLMPVLGLVFASSGQPWFAAGLLGAYALGHGAVIVLAGSASAWTLSIIQHGRHMRLIDIARKACGLLCIGAAVWFVKQGLGL